MTIRQRTEGEEKAYLEGVATRVVAELQEENMKLRRRLAWLLDASGLDVIGGECLHEAAIALSEEPTDEDYLVAAIALIDRAISRGE